MLRSLYIRMLRLHPRPFRERFADEMLEIFDQSQGSRERGPLLLDAAVSLIRQWLVRPESWSPAPARASTGMPVFHLLEGDMPRAAMLLNGSILSIAILSAALFAVNLGGSRPAFLIGANHPRPGLLPVTRSSVPGASLDTTIKFGAEKEDAWSAFASFYFKVVLVLGALDTDHDRTLSRQEIMAASKALSALDTDGDGTLSPMECGFYIGRGPADASKLKSGAERNFMLVHPVLAALDADHDGVISAGEIAGSPPALKRLDRDADGRLAPFELVPDAAANQAALLLAQLDANGDRKISETKKANSEESTLMLLNRADRDGNGIITAEELTREMRLQAERRRLLMPVPEGHD